MHIAFHLSPLFADSQRYADMNDHFSGGGISVAGLWLWLALAGMAGVFIYIGCRLWLARSRRSFHNPQALFREMCNAHQLDYRGRSMMTRLAEHHKLEEPVAIFLEPERFDCELAPAIGCTPEQIEVLRDTVFGRKLLVRTGFLS